MERALEVGISNKTAIPWVRVLVEGLVIVLSILLAFGIDAWWDGKAERGQTREHLEAVRSELLENARRLEEHAVVCARQTAASRGLLSLMGPDPDPVPADSLIDLLAVVTYPSISNRLTTTAINSMIAEGQFAAIESTDLQRSLGEWISADVSQRIQQRENTRTQVRETQVYVETILPYALVSARFPSASDRLAVTESRFPLDVARVLSDATLEGSLSLLSSWRLGICDSDSQRQERIGTLLGLLDAELAR